MPRNNRRGDQKRPVQSCYHKFQKITTERRYMTSTNARELRGITRDCIREARRARGDAVRHSETAEILREAVKYYVKRQENEAKDPASWKKEYEDFKNDDKKDDDDAPLIPNESDQKSARPRYTNGKGCSICCEPYDENNHRGVVPGCGHICCFTCMAKLVKLSQTTTRPLICALCRVQITFVTKLFV